MDLNFSCNIGIISGCFHYRIIITMLFFWVPLCQGWCRRNTMPWTRKCTFSNCAACSQCQTSDCDSNPCSNGGTCSIGGDGSTVCTCVPGYSGSDCSESICDDAPCQNGGTCSVAIGGSSVCACAAGYSGPTCTASDCDSNPCLFGGSCSIGEDGSTVCTCLSGYSGATCENENEGNYF